MGAEPTPSGSVELRDYLAVLRRQLVLIVAGAGAAAARTFRRTRSTVDRIHASQGHHHQRLRSRPANRQHVQVDVPANSQVLRVRYRDTARPPQARLTPLNNRLQPLNVQLNGFLSLDFTPGTVITEAGLPSRPAPTAASNRHQPARRAVPGRGARVRP